MAVISPGQAESTPGRMNVLFLVVDDLNTWLLGDTNRYSGKVVAFNIRRLADSGVIFTRAYTDSPYCSPSRTAFLSGVSPWKSGVYHNGVNTGESPALQKATPLQGVYRTLAELCGIKPPDYVDGRSLAPLFKKPDAEWQSTAISALFDRYVSIRNKRSRYIRYSDDQEEFYGSGKDPNEWTNQINDPEYASAITKLRASVPALPEVMPPVPANKGNKSNDERHGFTRHLARSGSDIAC